MIYNLNKELQDIAESIKTITNIDVTIIDKNLQRIAGTGIFKSKIGEFVPKKSVFHKSLILNKQYFVTKPTKDPLCEECSCRSTCKEKAELCVPIKVDNNIVGVLGMCLFDDNTKKLFIDKYESYKNFQNTLSDLISAKINEKKLNIRYDSNKNNSSNSITFNNIIGENDKILCAKRQAIEISNREIPILLIGEKGTGKELFARAIHDKSNRREDIFISIDCDKENLFNESNVNRDCTKFEIAKNGTVFLDEIGNFSFNRQREILEFIKEKNSISPRVISSTTEDFNKLILKNKFNKELFNKLNVIAINIPPLRDRGYDIIILSKYFLNKYNSIYKKEILGFTKECEMILLNYSFPGNVRELKNLIEYAVNFEMNSYISVDTIKSKLCFNDNIEQSNLNLVEMTKEFEKNIIKNNLDKFGYDLEAKKKIAEKLGISIATLYRKMESD